VRVALHFEIEEPPGGWLMEEESVPETPLHDAIIELLMLVLKHWAHTEARSSLVTSNLGCRWDPDDARVGVDPDVVLIEPAPPEGEQLTTLRIWEPGHVAPRVAVEIVSANTAAKDYLEAPARCARLGVRELWIFDPRLDGPSATGGPFTLQIWRANEGAEMTRVHAGPAPAFSEELGAWLIVAADGSRLRLAADAAGHHLWPTAAEAEAARAATAEAEVARLRRLLDERNQG
jgi:Uma2 family endonuclease